MNSIEQSLGNIEKDVQCIKIGINSINNKFDTFIKSVNVKGEQ